MKFFSKKAASKATTPKVIVYVMNPEKCCKDENGNILISTIGLSDDRPFSQQFREAAELCGRAYSYDDRKYYHLKYTVSVSDYVEGRKDNNITPEQLLKEARKFVEDNFPGYQAVITVQYHDNSKSDKNFNVDEGEWKEDRKPNEKHMHAHIVLNASPYDLEITKKKIDLSPEDLDHLRDYAYEAGKEYHLNEGYWRDEVKAKRERQQAERDQKLAEKGGPEGTTISAGEDKILDKLDLYDRKKDYATYSWKEQYRIAIDEARQETTNLDMFREYLQEHFNISTHITKRGTIQFKHPDRKTFTSGTEKVLGSDYTREAIEKSLEENRKKYSNPSNPNNPADMAQEVPLVDPAIADDWRKRFDEELERLKQWEEEYKRQSAEWLKRKDKKDDREAEYRRDRMLLEQTAAFYRLCEEVVNNEALSAALTDQEKERVQELRRRRELLEQEEEKKDRIQKDQQAFYQFRADMKKKYKDSISDAYDDRRDHKDRYYDCLRTIRKTNNLLVMLVATGVALYEIKKEKEINREIDALKKERDTFYKNTSNYEAFEAAYGNDIAAGKQPGLEYMDKVADTYQKYSRELERERYIDTLQRTGTSLDDRIAAAQGIKKMNIEEGRKKDYQTQAQEVYGRDTRRHSIGGNNVIHAKVDWELQRKVDSVRIARELGANNLSELELRVKQEGREYGKIKKEYEQAMRVYWKSVGAATAEINADPSLSLEERTQRIEEVQKKERENVAPIEKRFEAAKKHYAKCASALGEWKKLDAQHNTVYQTEHKPEPKKEKQQEPEAPKKKPKSASRTKTEAKAEEARQHSEMRDWADEAISVVAQKGNNDPETAMQEWAKEMEKHGCTIRITDNTVSIKHPDGNHPVRSSRLGSDYTKGALIDGIANERQQLEEVARKEREDAERVAAERAAAERDAARREAERAAAERAEADRLASIRAAATRAAAAGITIPGGTGLAGGEPGSREQTLEERQGIVAGADQHNGKADPGRGGKDGREGRSRDEGRDRDRDR